MSDDLTIPNPAYRGNRAGRYGTGQGRVQPSMDPDTRRLMLFAGALGVILSILIATSAIVGHRRSEVPVITADPRPIRIKPDNPGGMKIGGADNDLFSGEVDNKTALLTATAETPDTVALTATATPSSNIEDPPRQISQTPLAAAPPRPAPVAIASPPAKPATIKPALPAPTRPPAAVPEPHASASTHQATVQLAALTSEEAAHNEWQQLVKRMPDLLGGRQPSYSRTDRDGRIFWRLRTAGFADLAQARTFCDHVRSKGGGCSVADF